MRPCPECGGFDRQVVPESIRLRWHPRACASAAATIAAAALVASLLPASWYLLYRMDGYEAALSLRIASRSTGDVYFAPVFAAAGWLCLPYRMKVHAGFVEIAAVASATGALGGGVILATSWLKQDVERPGAGLFVGLAAAADRRGLVVHNVEYALRLLLNGQDGRVGRVVPFVRNGGRREGRRVEDQRGDPPLGTVEHETPRAGRRHAVGVEIIPVADLVAAVDGLLPAVRLGRVTRRLEFPVAPVVAALRAPLRVLLLQKLLDGDDPERVGLQADADGRQDLIADEAAGVCLEVELLERGVEVGPLGREGCGWRGHGRLSS